VFDVYGTQKYFSHGASTVVKHWESLIDQKIREAMERGEFDDLPGKGKPVDTSENPFEDPEMRLAHRMLRNAGFAPSWIEERKDIDSELQTTRHQLSRVWTVLQNARGTDNERGARARWEKALTSFREQAAELNRRIVAWNLKVPAAGFQRKMVDVALEIELICKARGDSPGC
jgi:DnaJ family protein C protein 28